MHELCKEQEKLHRRICAKEVDIAQDVEWLREEYSPSNMMQQLMGRLCSTSGMVKKLMIGFGTVRSLFGGSKQRCECGCVECTCSDGVCSCGCCED